jgi:hypothetical protein
MTLDEFRSANGLRRARIDSNTELRQKPIDVLGP